MSGKSPSDKKPAPTPTTSSKSEVAAEEKSPAKHEQKPKQGKAQSVAYDNFVLDKVFPDPRAVFSVQTPRLSELKKNGCLFVFDANALLAPYRLGAGQADDISNIFHDLAESERLFAPARAVQEFARHRSTVLKRLYDDLSKWNTELDPDASLHKVQCPILEHRDAYKELVSATRAYHEARKAFVSSISKVMEDLTDWCWDDPISVLYNELFTDSRIIGHDESKSEVLAMLEYRIAHKLPPGFKDGSKDDEGIGDLLIWLSMLRIARQKRQNIVFVCNEEKPDWVVRTQKKVLGLRAELVYEFFAKTGCHIGLASFSEFLKLAGAKRETVAHARTMEESQAFDAMMVREAIGDLIKALRIVIQRIMHAAGVGLDVQSHVPRLNALVSEFSGYRDSCVEHGASVAEVMQLRECVFDLNKLQTVLFGLQMLRPSDSSDSVLREQIMSACADCLKSQRDWEERFSAAFSSSP